MQIEDDPALTRLTRVVSGIGYVQNANGFVGFSCNLEMTEEHQTLEVTESMRSYYFDEILKRDNTKRVLNKTPHIINKLRYVRSIFPNARFIYIIRDGMPVVASMMRIMDKVPNLALYLPEHERAPGFWVMHSPLPVKEVKALMSHPRIFPGAGAKILAEYWLKSNQYARAFADEFPDQVLSVRYEQLCADPPPGCS